MTGKSLSLFILWLCCPGGLFAQAPVKSQVYTIHVPANAPGWTETSIRLKKGDFVLFQAPGTVDLGAYTLHVPATGSDHVYLTAYSRYWSYRHGSLLCKNGDSLVPALSSSVHPRPFQAPDIHAIPLPLQQYYRESSFTGNYFISRKAQTLQFIVNDKKINDNQQSFTVRIAVLPTPIVPVLDGLFDFAAYVDQNKGQLPFCFAGDCMPAFEAAQNDGGIWFSGSNDNGHYYLAINPIGPYRGTLDAAVQMMCNHIYDVFPGGAVDKTQTGQPEKSSVVQDHLYYLNYRPLGRLGPEVAASEVKRFHFTLATNGEHHLLRGTALHGLFIDNCGILCMFQQGRGIKDEPGVREWANLLVAAPMWRYMAGNLKTLLEQKK